MGTDKVVFAEERWGATGSHVTGSGSHDTTTKKKTREKTGDAQNLLPVRATSGHGYVRTVPLPVTWLCHKCPWGALYDARVLYLAGLLELNTRVLYLAWLLELNTRVLYLAWVTSVSHVTTTKKKNAGEKPGMRRIYFQSGPLPVT
jgi:hypothetical protein